MHVPIEVLVANYLKQHNHTRTLAVFENEAGVLADLDAQYESLEEIVADRHKYLEHHETAESSRSSRSSREAVHPDVALVKPWQFTAVNLHARLKMFCMPLNVAVGRSMQIGSKQEDVILVSGNNKQLRVLQLSHPETVLAQSSGVSGAASVLFKSFIPVNGSAHVLAGGMDGFLYVMRLPDLAVVQKHKIHNRVITAMHYLAVDADSGLLVSIGFDSSLNVVKLRWDADTGVAVEHVSRVRLLSNATDLRCFWYTNGTQKVPVALVTRLDSTLVSVYTCQPQLVERARLSLNDAEFSSHGFTASKMAVWPVSHSDTVEESANPLVAVATSHVPYMRLITVKLPRVAALVAAEGVPDAIESQQQLVGPETLRGMIVANVATNSPQDKYSNALIEWKRDGTGLWTANDDGVVRGVNFANNEYRVVKELRQFESESGCRFKCLVSADCYGEEVLITGATDKVVVVWR